MIWSLLLSLIDYGFFLVFALAILQVGSSIATYIAVKKVNEQLVKTIRSLGLLTIPLGLLTIPCGLVLAPLIYFSYLFRL